jgi:glucokinase
MKRVLTDAPVLAVDIGGTKVALAVVSQDGSILARDQIPTPRLAPEDAANEILERAKVLAGVHQVAACGLVLPAVVNEQRIVWAAESVDGWAGLPLARLASQALGVPSYIEFDGYAATLGEFWQGHGRGHRDLAIVIVGTGVGAGIVHAGRLYRGVSGVAGGIGWMRFPTANDFGSRLEDVASGPAILAAARAADPTASYLDTEAVFVAASREDPAAQGAVRSAMLALTAGVGAIVALLAPEIVVLGGSVGVRHETVSAIRAGLADATQPFAAPTVRIEPSALGSLSSLYGAAYLALQVLHGKEP